MTDLDQYCENGIHRIGDRDHCPKCAVWQRKQMKKHVFHAAREAAALQRSLSSSASSE